MTSQAPSHIYAWIGLGYCASLNGRIDAAAIAFEKAAAIGPDDDVAAIECASALTLVGRKAAAKAVLTARPKSLKQQLALGDWEEWHGSARAALAHFEAALILDQRAEAPLNKMIDLYLRRQQFAAARSVVDRLAASGVCDEATIWQRQAQILSASGERDSALEAWRAAVEHAPAIDHIAICLAKELQNLFRNEEAYELLAARPPTYAVLLALSEIELARRYHDRALRWAEAAFEMQPLKPNAHSLIARIETDRGQYKAAQLAAIKIVEIGQEHYLTSLKSRLSIAKAAGDEREALALLRQMVQAEPHDAGIMVSLARQYRFVGEAVAANKSAQAAVALSEDNIPALTELGEQAAAAEDRYGALTFYRQVLELSPEQIGHHIRVARLLYELNQVEEFALVLAAAETRFGEVAEIFGERIRFLQDTGQSHRALEEARRAHAKHPAHFGRWHDLFNLELRLSSIETVQRCLDRAPATTCDHVAHVFHARGWLARRQNDDVVAMRLFEAALQARPNNRSALSHLFELHLIDGAIDEASVCHARIVELDSAGRRFRRITSNASQSHQGQVLNDYRLDPEAVSALTATKVLPVADQLAVLFTLIKERPAHIPTALALLAALRRRNLLGRSLAQDGKRSSSHGIPEVIGQYWDEPNLPEDLRNLSSSWARLNPEHRYELFNDYSAQVYLAAHFDPSVLTAYLRCESATMKADLFRLAFLLREGGVWADMDDCCIAPLSTLIPRHVKAFFWQEQSGALCNNLMAASPRHPIIRSALGSAVEAINRGDRDKVWMLTGPGVVSRAFAYEMAQNGNDWATWLGEVAVLDEFDVHPSVAIHCHTSHKRLGKHWSKK